MIGRLTGEAKKARGVSKLARVKLTLPLATLWIADTRVASVPRATSEREDGAPKAPPGGKGEYLRGPNPRRALAGCPV